MEDCVGITVGERRDGPQAEVENYTDLMQVINSTPPPPL